MKYQDDTIAAIITPIGEGGISAIRISGNNAIAIANTCFRGKKSLSDVATHTAHYGNMVDENEHLLDEVLAIVFKSPNSYTGEEVVEINCHGSVYLTNKILENILRCGARFAEPGEFTKRAFLKGKMDLTQAEAVADLIHSRAELSYQSSLKQLKGVTSAKIHQIRDKVLDICSLIELELDFSEEDFQFAERKKTIESLSVIINVLEELISSYNQGKLIRDGVKVVICGEPNVGKSSLLNALLDEDRAIVTEISGTTRDVIEESVKINGVVFKFVDTAGLRQTDDIIEKEGIKRSSVQIQDADLLLFVRDITDQNQTKELVDVYGLTNLIIEMKNVVLVMNKADLMDSKELKSKGVIGNKDCIFVSAKTRDGLDELKSQLFSKAISDSLPLQERDITITSLRHKNLIQNAVEHFKKSMDGLSRNLSGEFIALDLRIALNHLGEITGEVTTEEVLNNIFSKFCIGK